MYKRKYLLYLMIVVFIISLINNSYSIEIRGNIISENFGWTFAECGGGGIHCFESSTLISGNKIINNDVKNY